MSQKVKHPQKNIHKIFDAFDSLYYETSQLLPYRLLPSFYAYYFKDLIDLFINYNNEFNYINAKLSGKCNKIDYTCMNSKNIIVCFSGGKDSIATALHYQKLGYYVFLYHLKNINKAYPKEYEKVEALAKELKLPLYIEDITLSGNHIYTEHPMKNIIIANRALQFGIRNNIGIKIAFGNYYTALLKDNNFDICGGDCRDMWAIYEKIIQKVLPKFKMYIPLRNVKTTLKALEKHTNLLELSASCIAPYRYRDYWKSKNEQKYNIKLLNNRCGTCWKCSLEYIYYTDHNIFEYNEKFYKHCLNNLLRNNIAENKNTYSIYQLWNDYLFYDINKSKLKGIQNAIIQTRTIKFAKDISG